MSLASLLHCVYEAEHHLFRAPVEGIGAWEKTAIGEDQSDKRIVYWKSTGTLISRDQAWFSLCTGYNVCLITLLRHVAVLSCLTKRKVAGSIMGSRYSYFFSGNGVTTLFFLDYPHT